MSFGLLLGGVVCMAGLRPGGVTPANAATGVFPLDQAAITVRVPDHVYLDAVTRAGNRVVAVGEHGVITYSDDDGVTWRQASVPVDVTLTSVAFATPREGWAAGSSGVILHTGDGGITWQMQLNGLQANQLTLAAAQQAATLNSQSPGAPNALRRADIFVSQGPDRPFLSILVLDPQRVIVFGAYRMTMRTDDGGKTWSDWSLNIGDPYSHNLYGAARVGADIHLVGESGLAFVSTDNGATFPAVTSPADATLFGVADTGDGALAYGVAGMAFKTKDSGKSWQPVGVGSSANLTAAATLRSGDILLAAEDGTIFISRDHATTFQPLPGRLPMALFDFVQAADGSVVAVGNLGALRLPAQEFGAGDLE